MKTVSIFLALINSLLAGLILLASLSSSEARDVALLWLMTKTLAALGIIVIGALTWLGNVFNLRPSLMAFSSLCLVALGAATTVWTFHLATLTGDMEYYMVIYGISLMIQGMASLFGFADGTKNAPA